MSNQEDEGREVDLIPGGISFVAPPRPIDKEKFHAWVQSIQPNLPRILEEHNAAESVTPLFDAFLERYVAETGRADKLVSGFIAVECRVLTRLTLGGIKFDSLVDISPKVFHTIEMLGLCPVITLFDIDDYNSYNPKSNQPYLGRIKVITFDEVFHQGLV